MYVVMWNVEYEGATFMGVFESFIEALNAVEKFLNENCTPETGIKRPTIYVNNPCNPIYSKGETTSEWVTIFSEKLNQLESPW